MYISHNYILNAYYLQAQQLHYNNCDVVILMHKRNDKRRCWHSYGTPGAGVDFLNAHNEVSELWEEYIYNYKGNKFIFLWLCNLYLEDFKMHTSYIVQGLGGLWGVVIEPTMCKTATNISFIVWWTYAVHGLGPIGLLVQFIAGPGCFGGYL